MQPSRRQLYQGGARRPDRSGTVRLREHSAQPANLRQPNPRNDGDDCEVSRHQTPLSKRYQWGARFTYGAMMPVFWPPSTGYLHYPQMQ
jgi:hypothetical protein